MFEYLLRAFFGCWQPPLRGPATNTDSVKTFSGIPGDHVESGTGEVQTRLEVRKVGFIFLFPWTDCIDQVYWTHN